MKKLIVLIGVILFNSCIVVTNNKSEKKQTSQRPNIVVFLVDDMGWQDTSVPFWMQKTELNRTYYTPNMERMAAQGMKFTQAYAASVCSPSRVSLMTGANPARHRVTNWTLEYMKQTDVEDPVLQSPDWNLNGMSSVANVPRTFLATPLPQLLKDNGYYTVHVGKAHFASMGTPNADPLNTGFDVNIAGHAAGGITSYLGTENFGNIPKKFSYFAPPGLEEFYGQDIFITEALTQKAIRELDKRPENKPFFLYLSHYAVHVPIMGDKRFLQKYLDKGMNPTEAKYATLVEGMDKSLGDILNYLKNNNLEENTVVIFMSDNGGLDLVGRGRKPNTCNAPLSSGKGSLREGGIREPMLVYWKGKIQPNTTTDYPVIIEDFFPTILEMAQASKKQTLQQVDGKSFLPILQGKQIPKKERPLFWHIPNKWYPTNNTLGIAPSSAVRLGDYKLIYSHNTLEIELFNLKNDIGEQHNLAQTEPAKARELAKILSDYLRSVQAQMPIVKATGQTVPLPDQVLN